MMDSYNSQAQSPNQQGKEVTEIQQKQPTLNSEELEEEEEVILWRPMLSRKKKAPQVFLEGYVEGPDDDVLNRAKSLTEDDLEDLKGCVDLGFGFSYDEIPELCHTLPALELCYSMSQKFLDDGPRHHPNGKVLGLGSGSGLGSDTASSAGSEASSPVPTWKISSPGDDPEDVKARLKFWAQTVACTVRLCN